MSKNIDKHLTYDEWLEANNIQEHPSNAYISYFDCRKEIDRLQQELERYKNIIDELEKYLKAEKWKCISDIRLGIINELLNKLKELKGE